MKTLVTGGAGFIGSHLAEHLLAEGHSVVVLDNFSTGQKNNIKVFAKHPDFTLLERNIADPRGLQECFEGIDWVFHLAGLADIVPSIEHPDQYYDSNVTGTFQVLQAAKNAGVKRFVYAASSSCYGIPKIYPTPETSPMQPQYPYALTKHLGEQLVFHWQQVYGLPCVSLRLFNVYGPRSRTTGAYGAVFGVFLSQKIHAQPYTVVGDGNQTRDFVFVSDVVEAFVRAADSNVSGEAFNVGSGGHYCINDLVALLGGDTVHLPKRPGEPDCTFADIGNIQQYLDWQPRIGFEQGVETMLSHLKDWCDAPVWTPETIATATTPWFKHLDTETHVSPSFDHACH